MDKATKVWYMLGWGLVCLSALYSPIELTRMILIYRNLYGASSVPFYWMEIFSIWMAVGVLGFFIGVEIWGKFHKKFPEKKHTDLYNICKVKGCTEEAKLFGYCDVHYEQMQND